VRHLARLSVAVVVGIALTTAYTTYRIWDQGDRDEARSADAIVVLGAAQYDGTPSRIFEARLSHAVDLWVAGVAPILIVTGGKAQGDRTTEAAAGRAYAISRGVPETAILAEDEGRTTLESLENVGRLMRAEGLTSAVFVSDRTHLLRVLRIATDERIVAWGSPTRTSPVDTSLDWQLEATTHELGALAVYFLGAGHLVSEASAVRGE